jgi:hypothetical protein
MPGSTESKGTSAVIGESPMTTGRSYGMAEYGILSLDSIVIGVIHGMSREYLGQYIVLDPKTHRFEIGDDCLLIEKKLEKILKEENLLSDGDDREFYIKLIEESDFVGKEPLLSVFGR